MKIKSKVKIIGTDITAEVRQIGQHGLCLLSSDKFGVFDRTVYGPWELEEIKEEDKYEQII
ncbi:hypothetical protein [Clostridium tyrobutyricum]|uniref:hypothetical protein n=1 Tax=Clostridium tyrobutyricum TaxID=1519 RepID=UPI00189CDE2E|nr:hypothetical protein [Clostridium tyrobutyricum]